MLSYQGLVDLSHALEDRTVLTVYINGELSDPARRRRWRIELRHALDDVERWLSGSSHEDRADFKARRALIESRLDAFGATIRAPGWVGFFTSDGEYESGPLPVAVPTTAIWSTGPCLAPYVRAMKEATPVIVAVVDHRSARLYRYNGLMAEPVDVVQARTRASRPGHMSRPARVGFHPGTRGPTATDVSQRVAASETQRLLGEVSARLARYAASNGWIVLGGIPEVAAALQASLPERMATRALRVSLDVHATRAQIAEAARHGASELRNTDDLHRIGDVLTSVETDGRGAVGSVDVHRALSEGNVRELYFTDTYRGDHAADAEPLVREGLAHHAFVEQVSGQAADALNRVGGVAARLRYPLRVASY
jgi:hypothetical protein